MQSKGTTSENAQSRESISYKDQQEGRTVSVMSESEGEKVDLRCKKPEEIERGQFMKGFEQRILHLILEVIELNKYRSDLVRSLL